MKIQLICTLFLVAALSGCSKKNDRAFEESPEERVNALINQYQSQLQGGTNGWKAMLTNPEGTVYSFFFKFNDKNRVVSYSDFKPDFAVAKESSYRLKALQQICLLFDTYTYLHVLADPDPRVAGGTTGNGYNVDFEFYFDNATVDTINLVGRKHSCRLQLVRATQPEESAYAAGAMKNAMALHENYSKILQYWKVFQINDVSYQLTLDTLSRSVVLYSKRGTAVSRGVSSYYWNTSGLVLLNPIATPGGTVTGFTNISWNEAAKSFTMRVINSNVTMAGANAPAAIETNSARNFRITGSSSYWIADPGGIRVNGVDNAYRTDTLTYNDNTGKWTHYYMLYQPGTLSATVDGFAPAFLNQAQTRLTLMYGVNVNITFPANGSMLMTQNSLFDGFTYPVSGGADLWRKWMLNTGGVYLVRVNDETYDMVNGSDPTSWIRWYLF